MGADVRQRRVLLITVIVGLIAAVRPQNLADLPRNILEHPMRNLVFGFLAVSAVIGVGILLMFTGSGFPLALASIFIALLGVFAGYVFGTYAIGAKLLQSAKQGELKTIWSRVVAVGIGAFIVSVIALIPYFG